MQRAVLRVTALAVARVAPLSRFLLLMGVANLINPDVPDDYLTQNTVICLVVCGIGVVLLLVVIAALRGILLSWRS